MKNFNKKLIREDCISHFVKLLTIMRLTVILILVSAFGLFASETYAQSKRLTLKMENAKVEDVLATIQKQSEFYFFIYSEKVIDADRKVSVNLKNQNIDTVLQEVFAGTNVAYMINDRLIVLSTPEVLGAVNPVVVQQQRSVSGKVTDERDQPLPGVTIVVKGTTQGTVTGMDGNYTITNIPEDATLVFSFVGMRTQEVAVGTQTNINISMAEEIFGIEEVVAVGYGVQKKVNLTGSISTVSSAELENRSVGNLAQALQGIVPNMQIKTTDGGRPGSNLSWQIRGAGTLGNASASSAPLFIIDGVTGDPNFLNPEDIENISVLKDAAASAIYGSRAPFGVVIITTKKGKSEQMKVNFSSNFSWRSQTVTLKPMGSLDYVNYTNLGYTNRGAAVPYDQSYIDAIKYHIEHPDSPTDIVNPSNPAAYYQHVGTDVDWWALTYRDGAPSQNYNVSANGGSKSVTYYFSLGYLNQEGQYRYGDDKFNRYSGLLNLHADATKWLEIGFKSQIMRRVKDTPNSKAMDWMQMSAFRAWPIISLKEENGHYEYFGSGIQLATEGGRLNDVADSFNNTLSFTVKPFKGMRLNGDITFNSSDNSITENTKVAYTYDALGNIKGTQQHGDKSEIRERIGLTKFYSINVYADYLTSINKHNFQILGGYQQENYYNYQLNAYNYDLISENVLSLNVATGENFTVSDYKGEWATQGIFGRFNYNYDEKYLFEVNGRYDGSSRFPRDFRWGFFPSASVGYVVSKEQFFTPLYGAIDFLKFRASYGRLGNTNVDLYYSASMTKGITNYLQADGTFLEFFSIPGLGNYNLTWEKPTTLNLAVDINFLKNRLQTSFDWYNRITYDMVGPSEPVASVMGTAVPQSNNTELKGQGWELSLNYKDSFTKDFRFQAGFNISRHRETITKYYNPTGLLTAPYEGQVLGTIWGYETVGFINDEETLNTMADQTFINGRWGLGDIQYKDQNDDGKINKGETTLDDHGDLVIIGNSIPAFEYNFNIGIEFKDFDLRTFFVGIGHTDWWPAGGEGYRSAYGVNLFFGTSANMFNHSNLKDHLDHWTPENTDAYYARPLIGTNEGMKNYQPQSRYLQNRAFLRMRNVQLGYTIPSKITQRALIQNARFYLDGENLLTFTKLRIYDPESPGYIYPVQKAISVGVKLTF